MNEEDPVSAPYTSHLHHWKGNLRPSAQESGDPSPRGFTSCLPLTSSVPRLVLSAHYGPHSWPNVPDGQSAAGTREALVSSLPSALPEVLFRHSVWTFTSPSGRSSLLFWVQDQGRQSLHPPLDLAWPVLRALPLHFQFLSLQARSQARPKSSPWCGLEVPRRHGLTQPSELWYLTQ